MGIESSKRLHRAGISDGPPPIWWWSHAVGGLLLGLPLLAWGASAAYTMQTSLYYGLRRIQFEGWAARVLGIGLCCAGLGIFAHMYLSCFDRLKWSAAGFAKLTSAIFALCLIVALIGRAF